MKPIIKEICKLAAILHAVAAFCVGITVAVVPHWFVGKDIIAGLFINCTREDADCTELDINETSAFSLNLVRGLLFAALGLNLIAIVLLSCAVKRKVTWQRVGSVILFVAGCLATAGLIVFTVHFPQLSASIIPNHYDVRRGYCYAVAWAATVLCFVVSTVSFISSFFISCTTNDKE